ncbi:MAG TPA: carboxypeptidase-like regulatory domain-containing protein [Bryobacteraceae bacterium]|nr:carboxypeptidase-like regulatory domain-containing protein [Bryobacteraceae bacterium]
MHHVRVMGFRLCRNRSLLIGFLLLAFSFLAAAQEGTILGTVTDPSGAVVPNAQVTLTNTGTNQVRHVTTNSEGQYIAPGLQIGHYNVRAELSGFKPSEQHDVALNVGDQDRLDFHLEVGNTQESVTVEANAIQVQTESGEVSNVINGQQVTQLATNGRSIYGLTALVPGASSNMADFNTPTPVGGDATVSFNGLRQNHNIYLVDGGEADDRGGAGGIDIMPSIDAIAEFRALTSNYSADYGLSSAGTMTMVFKSGTQDFHGTLWEFVRNDALDAGNFFTNAAGQKAPELRFNTYGFNVSGPVFIPKVYNTHKDRTFFFYNMEWRKLVNGGLSNQTVPPTSEYGGQFNTAIKVPTASQVSSSTLAMYSALGLTPGGTFPGNKIPTSLLDPNAQALLKAGIFPAANSGNQFVGGNKLPTDVREEIIRIDHNFSEKFRLWGHWVDEQVSQTYGTSLWSGSNVPTVGTTFGNPSYHGVIHATYSISPQLLNEVAFNYNGNRINIVPTGTYARPSGLNIPELFAGNNLNRIPGISLSQLGTNYDVSSWPWHNSADDYQVRDDVTWVRGAHELKMGASWALYKKVQDLFGDTQGQFTFDGSYTGNDFADFLLGYAQKYTELAVQDKGYWNNISPAVYFQDNWKVSPRLTLNLGLRWDGIPHTYEANNRMSNFYNFLYNPAKAAIVNADGTINPASPGLGTSPNPVLAGIPFYLNGIGISGQNGIPKSLVQNHWLAFGPRIGFAFDPTGQGKTVIRGGFGIMYERIQGNDMYNAGPNVPFSSSVTLNNVSLSNPHTSLLTGGTVTAPITAASITGLSYSDYANPASYQYSVGVQRELWRNSIVNVAYVGNRNSHQNDYRDINLPSPTVLPQLIAGSVQYNQVVPYAGFHDIKISENAENSHYNGLQLNFNTRMSDRLTFQAAYTLSRVIDPATSTGGDLYTVSDPYNRAYDNGPGMLDRTHIFVANFVYRLPFFESSQNHVLKTALGGWELSGIVTMESGLPLNITEGGSQSSNGLADGTNRPNINGAVTYPETVVAWFNKSIFSDPALGQWGNLTKGAVRGPGRDNWNLSLFKRFIFSEQHQREFQLRFESFNAFNHTQFNQVSTTYSSNPNSNFGQVTSVWDPRVFQLGAKLLF